MNDEEELFKNVIGEELWDELNSINEEEFEALELASNVARQIVALTAEETAELRTQRFTLPTDEFPVIFEGSDAFDLLSTVAHASDANCPDCTAEIIEFVGALTGLMLWTMIDDKNEKDNDE